MPIASAMFIPLTPIRFLHRAMDLFGSNTGVICGEKQFTYSKFGERCERLATALAALGIAAGDRVAYLSFNTHKLLEGYYGVVQARGIVMPLNVRLSAQELIGILNHSGARMLLFESDFATTVESFRTACPAIEWYAGLDQESAPADFSYEQLLERGHPERADISSYDENGVAELFYTSGSTGTPKGVMLSHRTLYLHALSVAPIINEPETAVDLHTIPLFHANGWGRPQISTMLGLKQVMVRRFDPITVLALIEKHGATHMSLVPTMANALLNCPEREKYDVSSVRQIMTGGAAASPELIERMERAFGCECLGGYGLTETAPVITLSRPKREVPYANDEERYQRQAMTGWAFPGVEIRVVDLEMRDVPRDMKAIGEIVTRSDHVMEGYFGDPKATKNSMAGGWFHTGDMAVWDEYGYLLIVDRKKEIIISGGENISSIEIEKAVTAHPDVLECAVVAAPDERWGEVPAAIVVARPESGLTTEALLAFLEKRIARFKLPKVIEFSTEPLPKSGTGKVRKLLLKEKYWVGKTTRVQG